MSADEARLEARVVELEIKVAFQERLLAELFRMVRTSLFNERHP